MGFPQSVLPVSVLIAPGSDPVDPATWAFEDITDDVRVKDGIHIDAGRPDEAGHVDPSKCSLTIDNRDGRYSPRNPLGPWYGRLRKNTPLQVRVLLASDTFTRTGSGGLGTSTSGAVWTHPSSFAWSTNGSSAVATFATPNNASYALWADNGAPDVELLFSTTMPVVPTGAAWVSAAVVRFVDINNLYRMHTEFQPDGTIRVKIVKRIDGVSNDIFGLTDTGRTYVAGTKVWTRAHATGTTMMIRCWVDGSPEPTTWAATADDSEISGTTVGLYEWRIATNAGSLSAIIDDVSASAVLFTGTVAEWPVRWDRSGNNCTSPVVAAGVLRRLQQGASPLRSPLYRALSQYPAAGYWPLEDGSVATAASSAVAAGQPATATDVTFAADSDLAGAAPVVKLNTAVNSQVTGRVVGGRNTPNGYSAIFLFRLDSLPTGRAALADFGATGRVAQWLIYCNTTSIEIAAIDSDGATVVVVTGTLYVVDPTKWVAVRLQTIEVGSNVNWSLVYHQVGDTVFYANTGSYLGTADRLKSFNLHAPTDNTSFAHLWLGDNSVPFVSNEFKLISSGYIGETASERIGRLCAEEGVPVLVEPGTSSLMGAQRIDTFVNLLRVAEDADMGVLTERGAGLQYRPRGARYNVPVALPLDFAAGHIAEPPEPSDDDQALRNDWTVTRDGGGSARYVDDDHVLAYGRYDEAATINIAADDELQDQAGWRVHLGTIDEMRWPSITLNLARNPTLIKSWLAVRPGSRITIANPPDQVAAEDIDLTIEGYSQTLTPYGWTVELNCSPARPWSVVDVDDVEARADTDGSDLNTAVTATATTLIVDVTAGPGWTQDPADYPFDINVGGERITLNNPPATSTTPQTFTGCTRSVNGVVKAQAAGTDIRLWEPAYVAL